ncbi:MAG: hypothetical protein HC837_20615 [Chloroflexaceae bacterium]|nr:hypothetical protein [Chloroflexaceae bacterium]
MVPADRSGQITLDHLTIVTLLALIWLFISVLPLPPNDLWWHMAAGRTMVQEGDWLHTNRWAYTLPADAPYVYQSWLSEILMYATWQLGDLPGLMLLRTVAIVLSYGLVAWHAWRRTGGHGKAVMIALGLAALVGWNNWTLRPQTLALLPASLFLVVLGEYLGQRLSTRWLIGLPILMLVWVNLHGSFMLGLAILGGAWLGAAITALRNHQHPLRAQLLPFTLATVVTGCMPLIHPLGLGIIDYVPSMLGNPALRLWFVEWQPPRFEINLMGESFWFL